MKVRASLFFVVTVMALVLAGCFSKVSVPEYGTLKGHIQESPENDVTKLTVKFGSKETNPKSDGSFVFENIETGTYDFSVSEGGQVLYVTSIKLDDGVKTFDLVLGGEIALANPGLEAPVDGNNVPGWRAGWVPSSSAPLLSRAHFEISDEQANSGQYSLKMDARETEDVDTPAMTEPVPAIPGFVYTGSISYFHEVDDTPRPYILLSFFDKDNNRIEFSPVARSGGEQGEWARFSTTGVAPEGTVTVSVNVAGNTNFWGVTYLDDVKLEVARPTDEPEE